MSESIIIRETIDGQEIKPAKKTTTSNTSKPLRADPYIWGIYIALLVISVIELFSASSSEVSASNVYMPLIRHGMFLVIGLGIVLVIQNIHYKNISRVAMLMAVISLGLLLFSNFFGIEINGAQRAIKIAGFTIQPAEIVKYTVVILLARILGREQRGGGISTKGMISAAIVAVVFAACLWKNGLTNTLLLFMVSVIMFLIGGMKWKQFFLVMAIYSVCGGALYMIKYQDEKDDVFDKVGQVATVDSPKDRTETHKGRISRFLAGVNPTDTIDDYNRQVIFSKIAQANGGILGQGPGNSRESARLPLAFSDYIYSIIVEDTGLVGGITLLILYLMLLARAGRIAYRCSRAIPSFMIMGCAVLIVLQALVHMAIVTGLFPVSGQPLPLISKGGTSVLVMSLAIGTMLSVSRFAVTTGDKKQIKAELKDLPEDMRALNYSNYENGSSR
ncbi:MAG: FtsW/RodA/SpoVE family cell cycle protein [Muribaculaceae bacterium]|nr:FtsW/RodA/SpoVE family cell cycle protein [Muribaculaceae bacterium]